jgi:aspartyl-tRNA(Asn)/glutamyl-tRNA(Gln) amidotransferase subunit B
VRYLGLGVQQADVETLLADSLFRDFFETEVLAKVPRELIALGVNYLLTDLRGTGTGELELSMFREGRYQKILSMLAEGILSSRGAKDLISEMIKNGGEPTDVAERLDLSQNSDSDFLSRIAEKVIADNPKVVIEIQSGKGDAIKYLVGVCMKESKGKANPAAISIILKQKLGQS